MKTYIAERVILEPGASVAVVYATTPLGDHVAIAAEPRLAADIRTALAEGERPTITVEPSQLLRGFPVPS